jgi:hypothetical protein
MLHIVGTPYFTRRAKLATREETFSASSDILKQSGSSSVIK